MEVNVVPLGGSLGDGSGVSVSQPVPPRSASIVLPVPNLCKAVRWCFPLHRNQYDYRCACELRCQLPQRFS